jgi:hypothetical protein
VQARGFGAEAATRLNDQLREPCIGADEEWPLGDDAQWRALVGTQPWSVDTTRAHTLMYIQVRLRRQRKPHAPSS